MAKKEVQRLPQVVIFVEGETDEVLFKALVEYYKGVSKKELRPCKICNLRGVTRYSGKLLAKLNDLFAKAKRVYQKGYQAKGLVEALDMAAIRKCNKEVLKPLEAALGVEWDKL